MRTKVWIATFSLILVVSAFSAEVTGEFDRFPIVDKQFFSFTWHESTAPPHAIEPLNLGVGVDCYDASSSSPSTLSVWTPGSTHDALFACLRHSGCVAWKILGAGTRKARFLLLARIVPTRLHGVAGELHSSLDVGTCFQPSALSASNYAQYADALAALHAGEDVAVSESEEQEHAYCARDENESFSSVHMSFCLNELMWCWVFRFRYKAMHRV